MSQKYPQSHSESSIPGTPNKPKTRAHYSSKVLWATRKRKATEASQRDVVYAALSITDRIARAKSRRGESKKELARLGKLLAAEQTKKEVKKETKKVKVAKQ